MLTLLLFFSLRSDFQRLDPYAIEHNNKKVLQRRLCARL